MSSQALQVAARTAIATACSNVGKPPIPVRAIVANVLPLPAVADAVAKWQSGSESLSDNPQFDRLRVVDIVRAEAKRIQMPIPPQPIVKDGTIARHITRQLRKVGLTVTRTGRLLVELPEEITPATPADDATN